MPPTPDASTRPRVLDAYVEIMLAANDVVAARAAAGELAGIAGRLHAPLLDAVSAAATGAVLLGECDAREALPLLGQALAAWRELGAPYEAARVRVLIALASNTQGNVHIADLELDAAGDVFRQLGARPDLARVDALLGKTP